MLPSSSTPFSSSDPEDNFSFFINSLGEKPLIFTPERVSYGDIQVTVAEKGESATQATLRPSFLPFLPFRAQKVSDPLSRTIWTRKSDGKAGTLMADQFFSSGLVLAEMVQLGRIPVADLNVLELGCASALPSFVSACLPLPYPSPRSVLITDYPDPTILPSLERNVRRNAHLVRKGCKLNWKGYEWGTDTSELSETLDHPQQGFDLIFLADLLWLNTSHLALLHTLTLTLSRTNPGASVLIASGTYTAPYHVSSFFSLAASLGFHAEELEVEEEWEGTTPVKGLQDPEREQGMGWREGVSVRKRGGRVRAWRMRWA